VGGEVVHPDSVSGTAVLRSRRRRDQVLGSPKLCSARSGSGNLETRRIELDYSKIITIDPGKRSGKACIRDTRITVYDVLDYMASGMTQEEILGDFPDLAETDIRACLAYAADAERRVGIVQL
jgi:uncharacterized protein (DUF433 family)